MHLLFLSYVLLLLPNCSVPFLLFLFRSSVILFLIKSLPLHTTRPRLKASIHKAQQSFAKSLAKERRLSPCRSAVVQKWNGWEGFRTMLGLHCYTKPGLVLIQETSWQLR